MQDFPRVAVVEQTFSRPQISSIGEEIRKPFASGMIPDSRVAGKRICVAVGSRGITDIAKIVKTVIACLKERGAEPFMIPAMGSHGGATEEGQRILLADYGVTPEAMGVPLDTNLETVNLGQTAEGFPVFTSKSAHESDGVILINRVKPHTDFRGDLESGLMKMIAIGLGKIDGANAVHGRIHLHRHDQIFVPIAREVLKQNKILGGLTILENAYHETAAMEMVLPENFETREKELLQQARELMPSLPVEKGDVLIVDRIGKNISGPGMDPNITGRRFSIDARWQEKNPHFTRLAVLGLTKETEGNAVGVGLADFCHKRIIDEMDRDITYLNGIISRNPINAALPLYFETDRQMLSNCFRSLGDGTTADNLRLVRIHDTLSLTRIVVSASLARELPSHPQVSKVFDLQELAFDAAGNLLNEY